MKTLHRFIFKAYLQPFLLTFFIALFVLFMQFLWKYVDELVGKGLGTYTVCKLFFYASLSLVPLALPLAILLSSLMTFGNLAEHYELAALKASGMSLQRVMAPLIALTLLISILAFYFSNIILPYANLKMGSTLFDIENSKPAFTIKEGVFYNGIPDYSIRVGKKGEDGKSIKNIMIYDHNLESNNRVITAESGTMEVVKSGDQKFLILDLNNGSSYEEVPKDRNNDPNNMPFLRNKFKSQTVRMDMSSFKKIKTDEGLFKDNHQMLNVGQLRQMIDTFQLARYKLHVTFNKTLSDVYYRNVFRFLEDPKLKIAKHDTDLLASFSKQDRNMIYESALGMVRTSKGTIDARISELNNNRDNLIDFEIEMHKKFALSISCLVMFFIGAPLGAIIRKGGLGMPVVVSLLFFVLYWVISIISEKMAKEALLPPVVGVWMAPVLLFPLGVFFTIKATGDSALFEADSYILAFKGIFTRKKDSYPEKITP